MASILSTSGFGLLSCRNSDMEGSSMSQGGIRTYLVFSTPSYVLLHGKRARSFMVVKAGGQSINREIRKSEDKVVDSVVSLFDLGKPVVMAFQASYIDAFLSFLPSTPTSIPHVEAQMDGHQSEGNGKKCTASNS